MGELASRWRFNGKSLIGKDSKALTFNLIASLIGKCVNQFFVFSSLRMTASITNVQVLHNEFDKDLGG